MVASHLISRGTLAALVVAAFCVLVAAASLTRRWEQAIKADSTRLYFWKDGHCYTNEHILRGTVTSQLIEVEKYLCPQVDFAAPYRSGPGMEWSCDIRCTFLHHNKPPSRLINRGFGPSRATACKNARDEVKSFGAKVQDCNCVNCKEYQPIGKTLTASGISSP